MSVLNIDVETYSSVNIKDSGAHKYFESPDFTILLISYSKDGAPIVCIDLASYEDIPDSFIDDLFDPKVLKKAFNAAFEIGAFSKYFGIPLDASQWECTMVRSSMCGYPLSLDAVAKALKLDNKKDASGKKLINLFSCPNKQGERVDHTLHPQKWQDYKDYNIQDVRVEMDICSALRYLIINDFERRLWALDHKINNTGILIEPSLVYRAIELDDQNKALLTLEAINLTGLANPNSDMQLKDWMSEQTGEPCDSLTKEAVVMLKELHNDNPDIIKMLGIKQELAKTSISKYQKMIDCLMNDNRIRGIHQLYGASKTGRWAGRNVQAQNLTHTKIPGVSDDGMFDALIEARKSLMECDLEELQMNYGNISNFLSSLIRTVIVAPKGKTLLVSDFAAIEARIIAWLANEKWRMEVFRTHGKIYEASASQMFKIPIEAVDKKIRSKGKIAELALGYQGSIGAMVRMGALKMGLEEKELMPIVKAWRKANPAIVQLWADVQECAMAAIAEPGLTITSEWVTYKMINGSMFITLPSGRSIAYINARIHLNSKGMYVIRYMGLDQKTNQWCEQETYGGKLVENIVQGIARDVLADSLLRLNDVDKMIVMHVHDEVVMETDIDEGPAELIAVNAIMAQEIPWAKGLPLKAASTLSPFYLKD